MLDELANNDTYIVYTDILSATLRHVDHQLWIEMHGEPLGGLGPRPNDVFNSVDQDLGILDWPTVA